MRNISIKKKILTLALATTLTVSSVTPAFATEALKESDIPAMLQEELTGRITFDPDKNGDGQFYYVALGDSVTAGFGLPDVTTEQTITPVKNYKSSSQYAYPYLVAQELFKTLQETNYLSSTDQFSKADIPAVGEKHGSGWSNMAAVGGKHGFGWSNMGIAAFTTPDIAATLNDESHITGLWRFMNKEALAASFGTQDFDPSQATYHDILTEELSKADLITLSIGSNDLMLNLLYSLAVDENPVIRLMSSVVSAMLTMPDKMDLVAASIVQSLTDGLDSGSITQDDVTNAIKMLLDDTLSEKMCAFADQAGNVDYEGAINAIRAVNPDAEIVCIGSFNPFGNSLTVDGKTYNFANTMTEMMEIIAKGVANSASPLSSSSLSFSEDEKVDASTENVQEVEKKMEAVASGKSDIEKNPKMRNTWNNYHAHRIPRGYSRYSMPFATYNTYWNNWNSWLNWTEKNVDNWTNWSNTQWKNWSTIAKRTESISGDVEKAQTMQKQHESIPFTLAKSILSKLGVDPEFIGSEKDAIKLANTVVMNYSRWTDAFAKFMQTGEEEKSRILFDVISSLEYPAVYMTAGKSAGIAIQKLNKNIRGYAEKNGLIYIDIYDGMPNETGTDPHPMSNGHAYMASQINNGIIHTLTVKSNHQDNVVQRDFITGSDISIKFPTHPYAKIVSVKINGTDTEAKETVKEEKARKDTEVEVVYRANIKNMVRAYKTAKAIAE